MSSVSQTPRSRKTALSLMKKKQVAEGNGLLQTLGLGEVDFDFSSLTLSETPVRATKTPASKSTISSRSVIVDDVKKTTPISILEPTRRLPVIEAVSKDVQRNMPASVNKKTFSSAALRPPGDPAAATHRDIKDSKPDISEIRGPHVKEERVLSPARSIIANRIIHEIPDTPPSLAVPLSPPDAASQSGVERLRPRTPDVESDDSDMEWINRQRTPARPRMVFASDSESDAGPSRRLKPRRSSSDTRATMNDTVSVSRPPIGSESEVEVEAEEEHGEELDDDDDEDNDDELSYDIAKHYDSSYGSLRDFIVDDSEEESCCGSNTPSPEPIRKSKKGKSKVVNEPIVYDDSDDEPVPSHRPTPASKVQASIPDDGDESDGIYYYSPPPKPYKIPDITDLTLSDSNSDSLPPSPQSKPKPTPSIKALPKPSNPIPSATKGQTSRPNYRSSKKEWETERSRLADGIFAELNRKVFEGKLVGVTMEWNKRLLKTAGMAHSTRKKNADGTKTEVLKIILSEKVLTGKEQILNTVAHEMCHLATWIISDDRKNPHGAVFKSWGQKVMKVRPDIEVTTTHSYTIEYKYEWKCSNQTCGKIYRRHSKSIDISKSACGRCKGRLEPLFEGRAGTAFQAYLKENMANAKLALPKTSHGEVMRALSRQWNTSGPEFDHASHWKALAAATLS